VEAVVEVEFTPELAHMSACEFFRQILVEQLNAKALVLGFDNMFGSRSRNDFDQLPAMARELGVALHVDTAVCYGGKEVSSTRIRKALQLGQTDRAAAMLGRGYRMWGTVERGRQLGRTLGFPTANVGEIDPQLLLPHNGAYAVLAHVDGQVLQGMANIGKRPTLDNGDQLSIEVNLFDFDDDIYGKDITLEFISFLRLEFKMCGLEELKHQLTLDRNNAKRILNDYSTTKQ
jgi:riboflavin kinase/FMN adenylyltransferase